MPEDLSRIYPGPPKGGMASDASREGRDCSSTLRRLGVTTNYIGFHQTLSAVVLARREPDLLFSVTKLLYPAVAREFNTSWKAVERNIRSVAALAWARNPALLSSLAGYTLARKPRPAQFIALLCDHS